MKNRSIENVACAEKNIYLLSWKKEIARPLFLLLALATSFIIHAQTGAVFAKLTGTPVNTAGWSLQGAAAVANITGTGNGEIMLCPKAVSSSGSVFYKMPVDLSVCDNQWTVEFDFRIFDGNKADGIAFCFLDAVPTGFAVGGGLGIPVAANGLKVCFDTYNNCGSGTVPKIEIRSGKGYSECWNQPAIDNSTGSLSFIRSAAYNQAKIVYNKGNINVYINGTLYLTGFQLISFTGYFGFTAGTGANTDNHSIRNVVIYPSNSRPSLADLSICSGAQAQIGPASAANYAYKWSPAIGLSDASVSNPQVSLTNNTGAVQTQKYFLTTAFNNQPTCAVADSILVSVLPNQPLIINYDGSTLSSVSFSWNAIGGVTSYDYSYTINGGAPFTGSTNTATSKTINGLNPGDEVSMTVTPVSAACSMASSQTAVATTLSPPCAPVVTSPSAVNITNGATKTYTVAAANSTAGFGIDILTLDNSFNLTVNGVQLNTGGDLQYDASAGGNYIVFSNGTGYGQNGLTSVWNITGKATNPLIRVLINPDGTVQLYGSKTSGGPLFPMHASNPLNAFPWNAAGNNIIVIGQKVVGPTHMTATEYGLLPVSSAGTDINNVCAGSSTVLTGLPNTGVWTIQPAPSNPTASVLGATSAGAATVDFPINAAGDYHYIYTVGGTCADTVNVIVIAKPNAGTDQTICAGTSATLTGASPVTGVWTAAAANPAGATIGATTAGIAIADFSTAATGTYNFIYAAGGCTDTMSVKVNANIIPDFTQPSSICSGEIVTALPATSLNGITGTWSPALNNTATTLYTFVPAAGQCANTSTMTITVNPLPVYTDLSINCTGGILNSVTVNATVSAGILEYNADGGPYQTSNTFNGLATGLHVFNIRVQGTLCEVSTGVQDVNCTCPLITNNTIGVNQTICSGTAPLILNGSMPNILPAVAFAYQWQSSADGILWTDIAGAVSEDFAPTALTQTMYYRRIVKIAGCANDISNMATITVTPNIQPVFTIPTTYCQSSVPNSLPAISDNGIAGTWNPATISAVTAGNAMYKFTPAAGFCAVAPPATTITITSNSKAVFSFATKYCQNTAPAILPAVSDNGINGTWEPATVTTAIAGSNVYVFTPTAGQCNTETVHMAVTVSSPPAAFNLGKDTTFCNGETLLLKPGSSITGNYLWQDGSTSESYVVKKSGVYHLSVSNDCGVVADTINITVGAGACKLLLPNAFTPDGNGSDDVFKVKYPFPVKQFTMIIYNRWGQKIFESSDIRKGWDGRCNGIIQSQDAFVWIINLTDMEDVKQSAKGTVILFR